jgi:hypothetical protein
VNRPTNDSTNASTLQRIFRRRFQPTLRRLLRQGTWMRDAPTDAATTYTPTSAPVAGLQTCINLGAPGSVLHPVA